MYRIYFAVLFSYDIKIGINGVCIARTRYDPVFKTMDVSWLQLLIVNTYRRLLISSVEKYYIIFIIIIVRLLLLFRQI